MLRSPPTHLVPLVALLATACGDADTFVPFSGGPAGVIMGSVTYAGPPPCTEGGHVVGAAILLAFDVQALPPPEGLGTQPLGVAVVSGDALFAGLRSTLPFADDGARVCADGATMNASAPYELGPLAAGKYQIRAFYDHDGDFLPTFSLFNLPSAGDVAGGAIDNLGDVSAGGTARFSEVVVGEPSGDGYTMPSTGALVEGVPVTLGQVLPLERPQFHLRGVLDEVYGNVDPTGIVVPADYQLQVFDPADPVATEASFLRLQLGAGVGPEDRDAASGSPFFFPDAPTLTHARFDANGDGRIDALDSIPETSLIPALQPVALLSKLTSDPLAPQRPAVLLQGVTLLDGLLATAAAPIDLREARDEVLVALRPAVLCIDPLDPSAPGVLVNTHPTDAVGNPLVPDEAALEGSLSAQFGRPISLAIGCLPQGDYAINLVYDTGQAWSVPNEAGICGPGEALSDDGNRCGSRPRLASQSVVVQIGPPVDPAYCEANPTPSTCVPL